MDVYIVTDPSNPGWDELVRMDEEQAAQVNEEGYLAELYNGPSRGARSFTEFAADWLDS